MLLKTINIKSVTLNYLTFLTNLIVLNSPHYFLTEQILSWLPQIFCTIFLLNKY